MSQKGTPGVGQKIPVRVPFLHGFVNPGIITQQVEMKEGFVITKVDGKAVKTPEEVERVISSKRGGILLEGIYEGESGIRYYGLGV
jgi:membrane-associated protease RseP (regulator of RpoE activity)